MGDGNPRKETRTRKYNVGSSGSLSTYGTREDRAIQTKITDYIEEEGIDKLRKTATLVDPSELFSSLDP